MQKFLIFSIGTAKVGFSEGSFQPFYQGMHFIVNEDKNKALEPDFKARFALFSAFFVRFKVKGFLN